MPARKTVRVKTADLKEGDRLRAPSGPYRGLVVELIEKEGQAHGFDAWKVRVITLVGVKFDYDGEFEVRRRFTPAEARGTTMGRLS